MESSEDINLGAKAHKSPQKNDGNPNISITTRRKTSIVVEDPPTKDDLRRTKSLSDNWKQQTDKDGAEFLAPKMQSQLSLDAQLQKRLKDNKGKWQRQFSHSKRKVLSLDEGDNPETLEIEEEVSHQDSDGKQRLTVGGMKRRISLNKGREEDHDNDDDWEPFSPAGVEWKALSRDDLWDPLELGKMWKTVLPEENKHWRPLLEEDEQGAEEDEQWHSFPVEEEWDPFVLRERLEKYKAQRSRDRGSNDSILSEYDEEQTYTDEPTNQTQDNLAQSSGQDKLENKSSLPQQDLLSKQNLPSYQEEQSVPDDLPKQEKSGKTSTQCTKDSESSGNDSVISAPVDQRSPCHVDPFPEHLIKQQASDESVGGQDNAGQSPLATEKQFGQKNAAQSSDHSTKPKQIGDNVQQTSSQKSQTISQDDIAGQKTPSKEDLNASDTDVDTAGEASSACQKQVEPFPEHLIQPKPSGRNQKRTASEEYDDAIHTLKSDDGYVSRNPGASGIDMSETSDMSSGDTLKSDLSSFLEDAEEELSCIVCFELLMDPHTPKNLECAHVCCALCLKDLLSKDPHVECPQCRHVTTVAESKVSSLKTNLRLRNLAEIYHKHSQSATTDQCPSGQCPEHGDRLRYYCQTCNTVVCGTCVCDSHNKSTHDVRNLQDVYTEQKSEMDVVIEMTSKRCQENWNSLSNLKAAMVGFQNLLAVEEESIDKETQQMIAKIQRAADAKKAVIRKGRQAQLESMDKKRHKLETHQGDIQRAIAKAKLEVDKSQEWDYVTRHHKMVADITVLLEQFKHFGQT